MNERQQVAVDALRWHGYSVTVEQQLHHGYLLVKLPRKLRCGHMHLTIDTRGQWYAIGMRTKPARQGRLNTWQNYRSFTTPT